MAIVIKENQALSNVEDNACNCGGSYCQPVLDTDTINIQGYCTPCTGENLVYGYPTYAANSGTSTNDLGLQNDMQYLVKADMFAVKATGFLLSESVIANQSPKMFYIQTNDYTATFTAGSKFYIYGSSSNDAKQFTVVSSYFDSMTPATSVYVSEDVVDEIGVFNFIIGPTVPTTNKGYRIKINAEYLPLPNTTSGNGLATKAKYYWFYSSPTITSAKVEIDSNDANIIVFVTDLKVMRVSTLGLATYTNGAVSYQNNTPNEVTYYSEPYYYADNTLGTATLSEPTLLFDISIDFSTWAGATTGCSQIGVYDSQWVVANSYYNGNFIDNLAHWVYGNDWSYNSGKAKFAPASPSDQSLYQSRILKGGVIYNVNFDFTQTGAAAWVCRWGITGSGTNPLIVTFGVTGSYSGQIDLRNYDGYVNITLTFKPNTPSDLEATIDNVNVLANSIDEDFISNCINVSSAHDCTLLFTATNNDNAFGFDYSNGLTHKIRLNAKIDLLGFPEDREEYRFSDNSRRQVYAMAENEYEVKIGDAPNYIHEMLRTMRLNDTFTIDGIQYIASSDYGLRKRKSSKLGQATFSVKKVTGISSNYSCS